MQKSDGVRVVMPLFGLTSGLASACGFLPHALLLLAIILFQMKRVTSVFIMGTIGARILGDYLFWFQMFPSRMDSEENNENWRSKVKEILFSNPSAIKAMLDMVIDFLVDALMIYLAFKISASPIWIFFVYSICHAIGSLIHGVLIRIFSLKNIRAFSMVVTAVSSLLALELNGLISSQILVEFFGLSHLTKSFAVLLVLGGKGLLSGTTIIGKTIISELTYECINKRIK